MVTYIKNYMMNQIHICFNPNPKHVPSGGFGHAALMGVGRVEERRVVERLENPTDPAPRRLGRVFGFSINPNYCGPIAIS